MAAKVEIERVFLISHAVRVIFVDGKKYKPLCPVLSSMEEIARLRAMYPDFARMIEDGTMMIFEETKDGKRIKDMVDLYDRLRAMNPENTKNHRKVAFAASVARYDYKTTRKNKEEEARRESLRAMEDLLHE